MSAKVKRRCRAMLRFMRSFLNSRGECRGEFRGELQGDNLGDPQGDPDVDCGFSLMGWNLLLRGKDPASPRFFESVSLMLLFKSSTQTLVSYSRSPDRLFVHLKAAAFFKGIKYLSSMPCNEALHTQRHLLVSLNSPDLLLLLQLKILHNPSQRSYLQAL